MCTHPSHTHTPHTHHTTHAPVTRTPVTHTHTQPPHTPVTDAVCGRRAHSVARNASRRARCEAGAARRDAPHVTSLHLPRLRQVQRGVGFPVHPSVQTSSWHRWDSRSQRGLTLNYLDPKALWVPGHTRTHPVASATGQSTPPTRIEWAQAESGTWFSSLYIRSHKQNKQQEPSGSGLQFAHNGSFSENNRLHVMVSSSVPNVFRPPTYSRNLPVTPTTHTSITRTHITHTPVTRTPVTHAQLHERHTHI